MDLCLLQLQLRNDSGAILDNCCFGRWNVRDWSPLLTLRALEPPRVSVTRAYIDRSLFRSGKALFFPGGCSADKLRIRRRATVYRRGYAEVSKAEGLCNANANVNVDANANANNANQITRVCMCVCVYYVYVCV